MLNANRIRCCYTGVHSVFKPLSSQEDARRLPHASEVRPLRSVLQHGHVAIETQTVLRVQFVADVQQRAADHAEHVAAAATAAAPSPPRLVAVFHIPEVPVVSAAPAPFVLFPAGQRVAAAPAVIPDAVRTFRPVRPQIEYGPAVVARQFAGHEPF